MPYTNAAEKRAHDVAYRAGRRAELAAKQRLYYRANRAACDAQNERYLQNNVAVSRAIRFANNANKRALRWGVEGKLYARDVIKVSGPCTYCGDQGADSWDHVQPLCKDGPNTVANLVRCCRDCNRRKARRDGETWAALR